jgi:hypothetical protein
VYTQWYVFCVHEIKPGRNQMTATITTAGQEHRCLRPGCGRVLRSAKSVALGYGPKCAAKIRAAALEAARADFTAEQQAKADELIRDGGLVPTARPGVFRAVSSKGDAAYLVHPAACNCAAGLRARRPCYHSLAARILTIASRRSLVRAA